MKINKQAVLDKIEAHYQRAAAELHEKQLKQQKRWDTWRATQAGKSGAFAVVLQDLADRVDAGEFITEADVQRAIKDLAHDRAIPYSERRVRSDWYEYPRTRPDVEPVETILSRYRQSGRFADLIGVLENMVGDEVAVSSLQKLGVLDTEDARLIFAANKTAVSA